MPRFKKIPFPVDEETKNPPYALIAPDPPLGMLERSTLEGRRIEASIGELPELLTDKDKETAIALRQYRANAAIYVIDFGGDLHLVHPRLAGKTWPDEDDHPHDWFERRMKYLERFSDSDLSLIIAGLDETTDISEAASEN